MDLQSPLAAALVGSAVTLLVSMIAFFVRWGGLHATHEALEGRVKALEAQMRVLNQIQADVSYVRGFIDGGGKGLTR